MSYRLNRLNNNNNNDNNLKETSVNASYLTITPHLADPNSSIPIGKIDEDEKPLVEVIGKIAIKLKDLLKKLE